MAAKKKKEGMSEWEKACRSTVWGLLSMYWVEEDPDLAAAQARIWVAALAPFTIDEIISACGKWSAREDSKPKPRDITRLIYKTRAEDLRPMSDLPSKPEPEKKTRSAASRKRMDELVKRSFRPIT